MSMEEPVVDGLEPGGDPGDTGEIVPEGVEELAPEEPARHYVEAEPDHYVKVRVNGEEIERPWQEVVDGYSRTEDYTRKTQEAAALREQASYGLQIQRALETDPEMAIRILTTRYGLDQRSAEQAVQQVQEPEFDDPLERSLWQEQQARGRLEQRLEQMETERQLDRAVTSLRQSFTMTDQDVAEVLQTAYQMGAGVESFPLIWKSITYDRLAARVAAQQAVGQQQQQQTQAKQAAAAAATQVVSSGTHGGNGLTNQVDVSNQHMSPREAVELAFQQLGLE